MQPDQAVFKAEEFIKLMIQHQPNLFGLNNAPVGTPEQAKKVAASLAELRSELIAKLTPQQ